MSYVDSQLLDGETVQYRAHVHKSVFAPAGAVGAIGVIAGLAAFRRSELWPFALAMLVLAAILFGWSYVGYVTSEFAVTNKRVIIKVGWLTRRTMETMLSKVEAIGVDQSVLGRVLNFGSVVVTGTGGTKEPFDRVSSPLEFRRQVQSAISSSEDRRGAPVPAVASTAASATSDRAERECPYCAETILARAKVCKHCGRDVAAWTAP